MVSNKTVMEDEVETVVERFKLKVEKIKEKIKPKRWAYFKENKKKLQQMTRKLPESDDSEHFKIFQSRLNFLAMFTNVIGFRLSYKWKTNRRFCFTIFVIILSWFHIFYSQYLCISNGEPMKVLGVFALYGIATSYVLKIVNLIRYFKEMTALSNFTLKLCRENVTDRRAESLKSRLLENFRFYKWCCILTAMTVFLFVTFPIKAFIIDREFQSLIPLEFIFLDQSTLSGFLIANIIMVVMGLYSYFVSVSFGSIFISAICNYSIQVDLVKEDIQDLDEMWSGKSATTVVQRHMFLKMMCRKHQDMNDYITEVKKIFDTKIFLYFCISYIAQIISLFEIAANNWTPGYAIAIALFLEIMFYCLMGTQLTVDNERLYKILQQSNWYTYDLRSQKIFLSLTHSCMNTKELWIGPLAPLSVLTGSQIVKSIYSYYTILMEVI